MCFLLPSHAVASNTPVSLYKSFEGNIAVTTIGNSELTETNGYGNCGNGNATSANLALPAGATIKAAYLYWYAMTQNTTTNVEDNYPFISALSNTSPVIFPGFAGTISSTRPAYAEHFVYGGTQKYEGHFADVTTQVSANPNGNYTVDVQGGASNSACPGWEENARAWNLVVIYSAPSLTENKKVYVYDGLKIFLNENITIPISGYQVPTTSTSGSMTVVSIQGDIGILGETMSTSDASFPGFPADFANSDHGAALDIDTLTGDFTANSTAMNVNAGSTGDLILTTNIILTVPTVPVNKCFALTDDNALLYKFDLDPSTAPTSVTMSKIFNGEGAAYRATNNALYAFDQATKTSNNPSDLYKVDLDGTTTLIANNFISSRSSGAEFVSYSDGTEKLIVLMDESASKVVTFDATDLANTSPLSTINLTYPDASTAHVQGLAVNPTTGEVFVLKRRGFAANSSNLDPNLVAPGDFPEIYSVNMTTGQLTLKTTLSTPVDAEGFAFASDGNVYTESEDKDATTNTHHALFRIDMGTGTTTAVEGAYLSGDIETLSCTGSKIVTPAISTSLTLVTEIINDNGGTNTLTDFAISTNAGALVFNAGAVSGDTTTFTSSSMDIATAGAFNLVAPGVSGYAQTASWWTCSGDGSHALSTTNSVTSGTLTGIVTIAEGDIHSGSHAPA